MAEHDAATDRARSWIVAACCCFCNLVFYGISRLAGIMLVSATETFHVSRASAAVPFSLSTAIRNLAGVFVGQLGHRFGVGPVVGAGCLIASVGSGLCFFAKDMQWLTVCWGGIFGFGFGLSTCLLPLAINQNFVKHNGAASGLSYSGSYLGSFIFSPIIVWLLNSYGLQGTFLVISGAVLNVFVAAILLRDRKTKKKCALQNSSCDSDIQNNNNQEHTSVLNSTDNHEMWKQNIYREYMNSQCNAIVKSDKQNFIPNIYVTNPSSCLPRKITFSENNFPVKSENSFHQQVPQRSFNLLPNSFENLKNKKGCLNESLQNRDLNTSSKIRATSFHTFTSFSDSDSAYVSKNPISYRTGYAGSVAKPVPMLSKICLRKIFENRLSRGKYKVKCKLKLQKLKKVIKASLLKYRAQFGGQSNNVKLMPFKYLQSFLCHDSYKQDMPNNCLNLSFSHSFLYLPCEVSEKDKLNNFRTNIVRNGGLENRKMFRSTDVLETKKHSISPVLGDLADYNKNLAFSRQNTINSCDIFTSKQNSTYLFHRTHETYKDCFSNNSSIDVDSSSTTKTDDSQSSYLPSSSSEQSLHKVIESESKNSSIGFRSKSSGKAAKKFFSDWFHMLREPMFTVIGFTMSIQTFMVVCIVQIIEDYAKDVGIDEDKTHYPLMALSISNLIGTLTLGSITDREFISRHRFLSLCFLLMSISLIVVPFVAVSLPTLLVVIVIYGFLESGVIINFPILTKQFVKGERRQAVAIACSNVLSAPTVMLVPMLIGHFRDNIGCYTGLFHLLGATSFSCCVVWLIAPWACNRRNQKKNSLKNAVISRC